MSYLPYLITFGAGFGLAHAWRSKTLTPQPLNRDDTKGDSKSLKTVGLETGAHVM